MPERGAKHEPDEVPEQPVPAPIRLMYDPDDQGSHSVTINDRVYTWRDGDEASVPPEALDVYRRHIKANNL